MSIEENKAIVQQVTDAFNTHELDRFDALMTPELAQEMKAASQWVDATFADHQATIIEMIAEDDKVVALVATRGGHSGEWEGIAPTGKQWTNKGFELYRFADGKIVECTILYDELNHLKQLGATITPPAVEKR